jgi:hypothetical protein
MLQLRKITDWLDGWQDRRYRSPESSLIENSPNVTELRKSGFGPG